MDNALLKKFVEERSTKNECLDQAVIINQNFGLTKLEFNDMTELLKLGDESLFGRIFLHHFKDCRIFLEKHFKASHEIAYDISMDTLIEFRYKLLTDKITYGNLRYLFTMMAGQFYLKSLAKEAREKGAFGKLTDEEDDFEDKLLALKKAWKNLSFEDKKLLENHFYLDIPLIKMAEVENKTDVALRKQKQRALGKLKQAFFTIY